MPPADIPDFDSMTPEEVMAWMESLAKRQGAKEGFLTEANMDIAEIDPSTVEIDEPGYVPFGEETSKPVAKKEPEPPPAPEPEPEPEPMMALDLGSLADLDEVGDEDTVVESGGLAWLESLAADQGSSFPEMDLSALSAELNELPADLDDLEPAPVSNPLDWLGSLAGGSAEDTQIDFDDLEEEAIEEEPDEAIDLASITDPLAAGIDPMLWLESLAKRQGAKSEELTTSADMDIPVPQNAAETGPGYAAFSVEDEPRETKVPAARPKETLDPAAWLESMAAGGAAAEEEMSDDAIQKALAAGEDIAPDQMEKFFERQLERGLSIEEPFLDDEAFDPDAPPIPAELPDWLLEQVQPPDNTPEATAGEHPPALVEDILEPPNLDLPDWLQVDESQEADLELESIFESPEGTTDEQQEFFTSDPWVQAFTEEAQTKPDEIPEWYERNLRDPKRIAAVEQQLGGSAELEEVELPVESKLPEGEPEVVPDWLSEEAADEVAADVELVPEIPDWLSEADVQVGEGDIPDWLAAADIEVAPDEIPDWLRDTVETEEMPEEAVVPTAPEPVVTPPPAPVVVPAPAPQPVPAGEIAAVLERARTKASGGDVNGSLVEYERVIRANAALDHVVSDLAALAEQHKENPAVYRVLGDSLMRQGKLQAALDTYRKALNQL
jgi:hypothetical protein